ncbi:MAG: type II secretion system F family protein [Acidimicrobiales bacterium]|nr:type II secretion system F family protein [Acidimicrobiales bacterium]
MIRSGPAAAALVAGVVVAVAGGRVRVAAGVLPAHRARRRLHHEGGAPPARARGRVPETARAWCDHLLARLEAHLRAADLDGDPVRWAQRWAVGTAAAVLVALTRWGPGGAALVVAGAVSAPVVALRWRTGRALPRYAASLPGVLEAVAGRLRAGASLVEAVGAAADTPTGSSLLDADLAALARRVDRGQPFAEAVTAWGDDRPVAGLPLVVAALVLGAEAGGARARALDGVAATLRDRRAVAAEVDALSTQARASALVMMGAPVAFAALGLLSDPDVSGFLLGTPAGLACLAVGLTLDAVAGGWMLHIARSAR